MAQVIQIRRRPDGLETLGHSAHQLFRDWVQSTADMAAEQTANARGIASMSMAGAQMARQSREDRKQDQRDAGRAKLAEAMQGFDLNSPDLGRQLLPYMVDAPDIAGPMLNQWQSQRNFDRQLAAQNAAASRAAAAQNRGQLTTVKGPYGEDVPVIYNPVTQEIKPVQLPGMGGMGGWQPASPMSPGVQQGLEMVFPNLAQGEQPQPEAAAPQQPPAMARAHEADPLAASFDLMGVKFPQSQPQLQQPQAKPAQPIAALTPGTVVDGSGKPVQLPANAPWGKQEKQYIGGKEYYGTRTPNGLYFKVGGEVPPTAAERKDLQAIEKGERAEAAARTGANNVISSINTARQLVGRGNLGFMPVTGVGSLLNWIPGTTGRDLEGQLDTIKANMGFDKLQQMRANSPTGGALGAVSDFENKMLQSTIANLETSQSKEQFLENLQKVEDTYNRIVHGPNYGRQGASTSGGNNVPGLPPGFRLVN